MTETTRELTPERAPDPVLARSMKLPPVWPLAVAAGVMLTANAVVAIIGWVPPLGPWLLGQAGLLAMAWFAGKYFRDRAQGLSTGRTFTRWEDPAGTGRAIPLLYAAAGAVLLTHTRDLRWWPLVLALLAVAGVAHSIACRRPSAEPRFVVTDQTPPEPIADHKQVTMPWDLAPGRPDVAGTISTWIRRAKVAQYRPPTNPITKWEQGVDGTARPAFEWYVDHGQCDEIDNLADQISAVSVTHGLTAYAEVDVTLDLVQTIEYRLDDDPAVPEETRFEDYWRFPLETVFDEAGDCDDSSILAVALLSALGHRTCFFDLRQTEHAAIGVSGLPEATGFSVLAPDGDRFYFAETTRDSWSLGELPQNIPPDDARICAIVEPLRARRPGDPMPAAAPGSWGRDTRVSWLTHGLLAVAVGVIAYLIAAVS